MIFLCQFWKKLRWVNFPPLRKKTTIAPRKNDEKCPTLPRTTKKSLKKILQKKLKNNREKKYEKNYKTYTKNIWWMKKDYWTQWQFFESKEWKKIRIFKLKKYASEKKNLKHFSSFIVLPKWKKNLRQILKKEKNPLFCHFCFSLKLKSFFAVYFKLNCLVEQNSIFYNNLSWLMLHLTKNKQNKSNLSTKSNFNKCVYLLQTMSFHGKILRLLRNSVPHV